MDNCKVCGAVMENFEGYDTEYFDSEICEWMRAYCPHCKKWYRWVEVYKLTSIEGFFEEDT